MTINPEIGLDEFLAQQTQEFEAARRKEFLDLADRVSVLEDRPNPEPYEPFDPSAIEAAIADVGDRVSNLESVPAYDPSEITTRVEALENAPAPQEFDPKPLEDRIVALENAPLPPVYDPTNLIQAYGVLDSRLTDLEQASTQGTNNPLQYAIDLATIGGANDEERRYNGTKLALTTGRPMILPFMRAFEPLNPMTMSGAGGASEGAYRLYGAWPWVGNQNLEQGTKKVLSWIKCGGNIGMHENSLFINPGTIFDMHLQGFAVQGDGGSPRHGFMFGPYQGAPDGKSRNLYRCSIENIAMNFMAHGIGSSKFPVAMTAVGLYGNMEYLNCWPGNGGFLTTGGSDCYGNFHLNAGPSGSSLQAGRIVNGLRADWLIDISSMSKTTFEGEAFLTANSGWGGLRVRGGRSNTYGLDLSGFVVEGYKPTGSAESGPAHGTLVRLEGGVGSISRFKIGQGMARPLATEKSVFEILGGDWSISNITMYQGDGAPGSREQHTPYFAPEAKVETFGIKYREAA